MHYLALFFLIVLKVQTGENAKILALFTLPGKSHFNMFEPFLKGLVQRGHEVDVVSHFPQKEPIERYTDFSIKGTMPLFVNKLPVSLLKETDIFDFMLNVFGIEMCKAFFKTDIAIKLKNPTKKYDLIVTEIFTNDCLLGYAHVLKVPVVALTCSVNLPWASDLFGLPDNPSYIPNYFSTSTSDMNLWERLSNTFRLIYAKFKYEYVSYPTGTKLARDFFGTDLPDIKDLANNISLLLLNSHLSIHQARPMVPNVIEVGGLHVIKEKPLSKYFEEAVQTNLSGVIYLSTGSMLMTESFDLDKLTAMFSAFEELPYKVLWKADKDKFPVKKFPNNIQFEQWMPQMDLLCHPNVKLFITHGGLMGTQEATFCGVPVIGIPMFADQEPNLNNIEKNGRGLRLSYENITKENLLCLVNEVLGNAKYKKNCEMASQIFKDRPIKPLDEALYWTEYVLRYNGAPHLRTKGSRLPWYQYLLMDVLLIVTITLIVFLTITYHAFRWLFQLAFKKTVKKQKKT